ncbi:replication initiation/membrane attachment protein [Levilactobacillus parabrevis]|uniref:replication initiation and membrane attachment family protein n=1 Tax=Levilactobacillus parabrevis TaxID=357278 RepID=UPI0021A6C7DD|nr:DnaD domain protein [Levilactobacillus parabrevis]MCT4489757.1 replication initiation/membrane attachment protein [Levilactobacillus parabrevis]
MEDSWHQLQPKTGFLVRLADRLTDQSWQTLTQLYQPIIGPSATGLFSALFWLPQRESYKRHAILLAELGLDLAHLYAARLRLEATGLLTTQLKTEGDLSSFVYELHAPLTPQDFFKDDLLSVQLLGVVGEDLYQALVTENTVTPMSHDDEQNITKNFLDVFHVDGDELRDIPEVVTNSRQNLTAASSAPDLSADKVQFDFKLLGELLERSFVDTRAVSKYRQLLLTEYATYGLDEPTMARYIGEATDLATNIFNPEQFKRIVAQTFGYQHRGEAVSSPASSAASTPSATESTASRASSAEQALIKVASSSAPVKFLQGIKQSTGGFVTDGEQRIVRDLVSRQLFPESVLNLMIYHVLVDEDKPTLNKNLLDTIANDWSKSKVSTPELAIQKIRERQQAMSKPRRSRRQQPTVKETLPDWAKKPSGAAQAPTTAKLTDEQQKQLQQRIARLEARSKGKED